jgi:hypothetical protein
MRAKLEIAYNTDKPEDVAKIKSIMHVDDYKIILWDLDQYLRGIVKYGISNEEVLKGIVEFDPTINDIPEKEKERIMTGYTEACDKIRSKLWELCKENSIDINDQ